MSENFKTDFFIDRIGRGIQGIFQAQLDITTERIYQKGRERKKVQGIGETIQGRSDALMAVLQNPNYSVILDGEGVIARSNLPLYTRFLDMEKRGNYQIYNRQTYGILYRDMLGKVKYEHQDYVREKIKEMFAGSLEQIIKLIPKYLWVMILLPIFVSVTNKTKLMPEIYRFSGTIIFLYRRNHSPSHIHFTYDDYEYSISVLDRIVDGQAPAKVIAKVNEWVSLHEAEILFLWERAQKRKKMNKTESLK